MILIPTHLRQLEYVVAVADTGSTAAAARACNVSQPSVSVAISGLEKHLGQALFQRASGQGLQLTPFGRQKVPELRRLLSQASLTLAPSTQEGAPFKLTLGVFSTLGPRHVPKLMRLYAERYPGSRIILVEDDLEGLVKGLTTGRIDLAILYDIGLTQDVIVTDLKAVRPYALVSETHRLASSKTVELRDLLKDPLILINLPYSRSFFLSIAQMQNVPVTVGAETNSIEMVRAMVANGLGVGLLATDISYPDTYDGLRVRRLEIAGDVPPHRIVIARAAALSLTDASAAFIDLATASI